MHNIVFDLGKVLIDWDPALAFTEYFDDPRDIPAWMERIDFHGWNLEQDGGRSFADGIAAARQAHGEDARPLEGYVRNFPRTIARPVPGTWEVIETLDMAGVPLFAITNWSADTWPAALQGYPRLHTIFRDIVVSGRVGLRKPDPAIFGLLLDRHRLAPGATVFIDDSAANVEAARNAGMTGILFTDARALSDELAGLGF